MSPRPYSMERRTAAAAATRGRIIDAARELCMESGSFSMEQVAMRAGVARMTVYYQFDSKSGLLEALFDRLAESGLATQLPRAFAQEDAIDSLRAFIEAFVRFWASDRLVMRHLAGAAAIDDEVGRAVATRGERRRHGLRVILDRLAAQRAGTLKLPMDDAIDLAWTLTTFETFDALSGETRSPEDTLALIQAATLNALGLERA